MHPVLTVLLIAATLVVAAMGIPAIRRWVQGG